MNLRQRILKRYLPVVLVLAVFGYLLAEAFLMVHQIYGGRPDPSNSRVRWHAPLKMAGFGLSLLLLIEALTSFIRRKPTTDSTAVDLSKPLSVVETTPQPTP